MVYRNIVVGTLILPKFPEQDDVALLMLTVIRAYLKLYIFCYGTHAKWQREASY